MLFRSLEEVRQQSGRQFDPELAEPFIACLDELTNDPEPAATLPLSVKKHSTRRPSNARREHTEVTG